MRRILAIVLCALVLAGCTTDPQPTQTTQAAPATDGAAYKLYEMLFDLENKVELQLDMSDEELEKMRLDYEKYDRNGAKSPIYRMADLTVTVTTPDGEVFTQTVKEVGVRMKGNTSRTDFYSSAEGIYNLIHLKLSFQETFDDAAYYGADAKQWDDAARQERKNRTFATLEKLELRWNRCDDGTYLKEYFAYETYRQYGVAAPRTNLASFDWAGTHMGVYTVNEPVDEVFLSKRLPEEALGGDLYKVGWGGGGNGSFTRLTAIGIENEGEGEFYAYDLKTNKKTSSHEALTKLIKALNSGTVTKERFAQLVDLDSFLPYCAVSYLLGNPDDLRNNYNNCYIYFRADTGKMIVIPYDFDRCLGITAHWNPTGNGVTGDDPFGKTILATGEEQNNPLILCSVASGGWYVAEYADHLAVIADGNWFTYENFAALYATAEKNYSNLSTPEKEFHNAKGLYLSFDIDRTSDFSSMGNICIREYLDAKNAALAYYLPLVDENAAPQPPAAAKTWYIRADFTDWRNDDRYSMTEDNGVYAITVTADKQVRLKVYNDLTGQWYGAECVPEDCAVPFDTDDHTNIVLEKGVYRITIDPETEIITIEEQ